MEQFIGRQKELDGLKGLLRKATASLVVVRGRRRIGKSRLAEEYAKLFPKSLVFIGLPPEKGVTAAMQRREFARQMIRKGLKLSRTDEDDWGDMFDSLASQCREGRILVVLDEITWMGGLDPTFLPKLKTAWDINFKKNPRLVLWLSGSNSTWIEANLLSSTGFVGRVSFNLSLRELPLDVCSQFWGAAATRVAAYEKFKVLCVTGGVPRYLEEVRADQSAEANIARLCFESTGILYREFEQIFSELFSSRSSVYREIVEHLAGGRRSQSELQKALNRGRGGDLSTYLDALVESGFLAREANWSVAFKRSGRFATFRIRDNYTRFYLKYIEPNRERIDAGLFEGLPRGWKSILGLQFENLVCASPAMLFRCLELKPEDVLWSGPYRQTSTKRRPGCQIDYLIQTKHRSLYLCEVKFSEREIPAAVMTEVSQQEKRIEVPRGFSLRHVLVHVNGVSESVENSDLFAHIVDFSQLLET